MLRNFKRIVPVTGMAVLLGLAAAVTRGADAGPTTAPAGKASLVVTAVDADGKPVVGAKVSLFASTGAKHKKAAALTADPPTTAPAGGDGKPKLDPLATGTTDADGKATLTGLADGTYTVRGRLKSVGNGHADVTIADGKDAAVSLTLKVGKKKAA